MRRHRLTLFGSFGGSAGVRGYVTFDGRARGLAAGQVVLEESVRKSPNSVMNAATREQEMLPLVS